MSNKAFLTGNNRLLLAGLLIVFIAAIAVLQPPLVHTGFQVASVSGGPTVSATHYPTFVRTSEGIIFTATASSPDIVKEVNIYVDKGTKPAKTCTESPCELITGIVVPGKHTYYADVTDNENKKSKSDVMEFFVPPAFTSQVTLAEGKWAQVHWTKPAKDFDFYRVWTKDCNRGEDAWQKKKDITKADLAYYYNARVWNFTLQSATDCYSFKVDAWSGDVTFPAFVEGQSPKSIFFVTESADRSPPKIEVSSKKESRNNFTITAVASDNIGGLGLNDVQIWTEEGLKQSCQTSPCSYSGTFAKGTHYYYGVALDNTGAYTRTDTRSFRVRR